MDRLGRIPGGHGGVRGFLLQGSEDDPGLFPGRTLHDLDAGGAVPDRHPLQRQQLHGPPLGHPEVRPDLLRGSLRDSAVRAHRQPDLPSLLPSDAALQRLRVPGAPFRRPGPLSGQRALHPLARDLDGHGPVRGVPGPLGGHRRNRRSLRHHHHPGTVRHLLHFSGRDEGGHLDRRHPVRRPLRRDDPGDGMGGPRR